MTAVSKFDKWFRPHCVSALLDLVDSSRDRVTTKARPDEGAALAAAIMDVLGWLIRLISW